MLAVVVAVPPALVGVADMRGVRRSNRAQLDEALRQQAELAAVAFDRWTDAQRQPLTTLAAEAGEQRSLRSPQLAEARPDGSMYMMTPYKQAGYWVAYSRTPGDSPLVIITMQKTP